MDHRELIDKFDLAPEARRALEAFVSIIEIKDPETYEHSVKVASFLIKILEAMHLDPKVGLFSGLLHDIGKVQSDLAILRKKENFTTKDLEHVSKHVLDGYRLLKGLFDFTAEVIIWHHEFQRNPYPHKLPKKIHDHSMGVSVMIPLYGRLLVLADFYEAVHRPNDKYGPQTGENLRILVENNNLDLDSLVEHLYDIGIFDDRLGTSYVRTEYS